MTAPEQQILPTSKPHQWLTLIGAAFVVFEIVFIELYSDNFWFSFKLTWFGVPAIIAALVLAHFFLLFAQSRLACKWCAFVLSGKPLLTYTRWLTLTGEGFDYGTRHVRFDVIDSAELSWFGNLILRSRAICGDAQAQPDVIFKFPFSYGSQENQKKFFQTMMDARPTIACNERLRKRLDSPVVRGQTAIQGLGAALMLVLLFDLGLSSFYYLDMLKHYYLAETLALDGKIQEAQHELDEGDDVRSHPLSFSYITTRFLNVGNCASGLLEARAEALWLVGRKDEAIADVKKAIDASPESFREYLHCARLLEEAGKPDEARQQIETAIEKHKDALLPRLYMIAYAKANKPQMVNAIYRMTMQDLTERDFADEPRWPPGGDTFIHDIYYSKDIYFVLNHLLNASLKPSRQ